MPGRLGVLVGLVVSFGLFARCDCDVTWGTPKLEPGEPCLQGSDCKYEVGCCRTQWDAGPVCRNFSPCVQVGPGEKCRTSDECPSGYYCAANEYRCRCLFDCDQGETLCGSNEADCSYTCCYGSCNHLWACTTHRQSDAGITSEDAGPPDAAGEDGPTDSDAASDDGPADAGTD
jgi:hypothetical protein